MGLRHLNRLLLREGAHQACAGPRPTSGREFWPCPWGRMARWWAASLQRRAVDRPRRSGAPMGY